MRQHVYFGLALVLPLVLLVSAFTFRHQPLSPEQRILGNWNEVSWTYVKADKCDAVSVNKKILDDSMQQIVARSRIIHKAEMWRFTADSGLYLNAQQRHQQLKWSIMGSSNTLKISYNDQFAESYDLVELTDKRMVLHFENDLLARGIVRITFEKI